MRNSTKLVFLTGLISFLAIFGGQAGAQDVQNFIIRDFTADYYLDRNAAKTSTLHTVEKIQAEFPSYDQNHGILRAIPETYQRHTVSLQIASVTDENNTPINYTTSEQNGNLVLRIGDANTYVHGLKTYVITYDARNVALILPDGDEFYWDVNGDQWQQNFNKVTAKIHIAPGLASTVRNPAKQSAAVCFAGSAHYSQSSRCAVSQPQPEGDGLAVTSTAQNLSSGETLTFDVGFNRILLSWVRRLPRLSGR